MNRGLTVGMWGKGRGALAPSLTAIGPNTYLTGRDFAKVLALALFIHVVAFVVAAVLPDHRVTQIPVRALSFKLGGALPARPAAPVMQAVVMPAPAPAPPNPVEAKPVAVPAPVAKPTPKFVAQAVKPPKVVKVTEPPRPQDLQPAAGASSTAAKQYVREVGAAPTQPVPPSGSVNVNEAALQALRMKYEMEISGWIQRHKFYPAEAGGKEGRAVVRMRIDRLGNVRYYAIEQSSGLTVLDAAALDMIRRANPVPAVPENYPAGNLVEFLIPISFKAPS